MTLEEAIDYHRARLIDHQEHVEWLCELRRSRKKIPKLEQVIYALSECKRNACLCEYCSHRDTDPDLDEQYIRCPMMDEAKQLMRELGLDHE